MQVATTQQVWNADAISITGFQLTIGSKQLISTANFKISKRDRIAILGRNGCGKSTLFHWISAQNRVIQSTNFSGLDNPSRLASSSPILVDWRQLAQNPATWSIYEVAQELPPTQQTITQLVLAAHLERGALWERQTILEAKETMTDEETQEYKQIGEDLAAMCADADPPRARKILAGLGFQESQMDLPLTHFSGGWRARVALAQGLFMEPDLLLLDEPTNHLDLPAVLWLQEFCAAWPKTLLVISHNVGFVRQVANTIWDFRNQTITAYACKYDRFLKQRVLDLKKQEKEWETLEKEVQALKKKGTPQSKKAAEELLKKRQKEGVIKPEKPYEPKFFLLETEETTVNQSALLTLDSAELGYDPANPILAGVTFALFPKCRVALVGANGSGKSTFLKSLQGSLPILNESAIRKHPNLRVCTFDQHFYHSIPEDQAPLEWLDSLIPIEENKKRVSMDQIRKVLGASGLEGVAHTRPISTLSGGQKSRVYFASLSIMAPDILLLDEVTNHLDIETIEGLTKALKEFPGAMVIVSHDLDFLDTLATEVWVTEDGTLKHLGQDVDGLDIYVNSVLSV